MKTFKFSILALTLFVVLISCQKEDFSENASEAVSSSPESATTDTIGWQLSDQWEVANQETFSVHYFNLEDANITADVVDNGLVLLFKKQGSAVNALPFEEESSEAVSQEAANATYWYHQVSEGNLLVSCDLYDNNKTPDLKSRFKYFIINPEKLQTLITDGYTTEKLMSLSYTDAVELLETVN